METKELLDSCSKIATGKFDAIKKHIRTSNDIKKHKATLTKVINAEIKKDQSYWEKNGEKAYYDADTLGKRAEYFYTFLKAKYEKTTGRGSYSHSNIDPETFWKLATVMAVTMDNSDEEFGTYPNILDEKINPLLKLLADGCHFSASDIKTKIKNPPEHKWEEYVILLFDPHLPEVDKITRDKLRKKTFDEEDILAYEDILDSEERENRLSKATNLPLDALYFLSQIEEMPEEEIADLLENSKEISETAESDQEKMIAELYHIWAYREKEYSFSNIREKKTSEAIKDAFTNFSDLTEGNFPYSTPSLEIFKEKIPQLPSTADEKYGFPGREHYFETYSAEAFVNAASSKFNIFILLSVLLSGVNPMKNWCFDVLEVLDKRAELAAKLDEIFKNGEIENYRNSTQKEIAEFSNILPGKAEKISTDLKDKKKEIEKEYEDNLALWEKENSWSGGYKFCNAFTNCDRKIYEFMIQAIKYEMAATPSEALNIADQLRNESKIAAKNAFEEMQEKAETENRQREIDNAVIAQAEAAKRMEKMKKEELKLKEKELEMQKAAQRKQENERRRQIAKQCASCKYCWTCTNQTLFCARFERK